MAKSRLEELYDSSLRPKLQKDLGLKNIMEVPQVSKIVLNIGVKDAVADSRVLDYVVQMLGSIAGQKPIKTYAKKSIASFKIREGMPLGVCVTLRRQVMYEFLDRLINLALPKVKDFQGVSLGFDKRGGYNLGIREWVIFPEADVTGSGKVYGMNVTIQTTAKADEHTHALLEAFGMPFRKQKKK
jgi:large subunit ribosomal protein L5